MVKTISLQFVCITPKKKAITTSHVSGTASQVHICHFLPIICARVKTPYMGDGHPTFNREPL